MLALGVAYLRAQPARLHSAGVAVGGFEQLVIGRLQRGNLVGRRADGLLRRVAVVGQLIAESLKLIAKLVVSAKQFRVFAARAAVDLFFEGDRWLADRGLLGDFVLERGFGGVRVAFKRAHEHRLGDTLAHDVERAGLGERWRFRRGRAAERPGAETGYALADGVGPVEDDPKPRGDGDLVPIDMVVADGFLTEFQAAHSRAAEDARGGGVGHEALQVGGVLRQRTRHAGGRHRQRVWREASEERGVGVLLLVELLLALVLPQRLDPFRRGLAESVVLRGVAGVGAAEKAANAAYKAADKRAGSRAGAAKERADAAANGRASLGAGARRRQPRHSGHDAAFGGAEEGPGFRGSARWRG